MSDSVWTTAWRGTIAGARRAIAIYLLIVAAFAVGSFVVLSSGLGSFPTVIFGLFFVPVGPIFYSSFVAHRRSGLRRVRSLELRNARRATLLPYSRLRWFGLPGGLVALLLVCTLAPFAADAMPPDQTGRYDTMFRAFAFVSPIVAVLCLAFLLWTLVRLRRKEIGIGLDTEGVYHWSWRGCCFYPWKWIDNVSPRTFGGVRGIRLESRRWQESAANAEENDSSKSSKIRRALTWIPVDLFTINPELSLRTLLFYHQHAELREELGTDAAVERMRSAAFAD